MLGSRLTSSRYLLTFRRIDLVEMRVPCLFTKRGPAGSSGLPVDSSPHGEAVPGGCNRMGTQRYDPFLPSLAPDDQCLPGFINVTDVDADQLADADPRRVERFQHCPITSTQKGTRIRS